MALGAPARGVQRMVVTEGARIVLGGVLVGLAVASTSTQVLEGLLFGVEPADVGTFLTMASTLIGVGVLGASGDVTVAQWSVISTSIANFTKMMKRTTNAI